MAVIRRTATWDNATSVTVVSARSGESGAETVSRLNSELASSGGGHRVIALVGDFTIDAPLVVWPETTLDCRRASISLAANAGTNMLRNHGLETVTAGDTDIEVIGGSWIRGEGGGVGTDLHCLQFYGVTRLRLSGVNVTTTDAKFAFNIDNCHRFEVGHCSFDTYSDGVHLNGSCTEGWVHDIQGVTGDDFVAYTLVDNAGYRLGSDFGDSNGIVIERIYGNPAAGKAGTAVGNGVAIYAQTDPDTAAILTHRNVTIRDVHVTATGNAVHFNAGTGPDSGAYRGITVERVSNAGTGHGVLLGTGTHYDTTLRDVQSPPEQYKNAVRVVAGATVEDLTVADSVFRPPASTVAIAFVNDATAIVKALRVTNCTLSVATQSAGLIDVPANAKLTQAFVSDLYVTLAAWAIGTFHGTVALTVTGIRINGTVSGWFLAGTNATIDVRWAAGYNANPSSFGTSTGMAVTSRDLSFPADMSQLQRVRGSAVYNTATGLTPVSGVAADLVGPCVCDGTIWKNLATGATY